MNSVKFKYICSVCGQNLNKPPASETHSLGTWNCSYCKGKAKVKRIQIGDN